MSPATLAERILEALVYDGPMSREELSEKLGLPIASLGHSLMLLEVEGQIECPESFKPKFQAVRNG